MRSIPCACLLVALAACGGPAAPWPEPPPVALDLKIEVSATEVPLLAPITVQLDLYHRADLPVEFAPDVAPEDFQCERRVGEAVPFGPGIWQRTTLSLRPLRGPGELVLPPFVAKAKDGTVAASTPERTITVTSVLGEHGAELEAPAGPLAPPTARWPWFAGGAALLLATTGLWWFVRGRPRTAPSAIALSPHAKALRALARLRAAPRTTPAQVEAFYVEVSDVLRQYLEDRFGLCAPERTTEEFLRDLEGGDRLAREHRRELERFLSQCDLVKFAAHQPTENDHLATFLLAETFVERTRTDRIPAEVAS
ncbi:MAG: hypothetical protein KDC48_04890 [Planctomycetes bacterium]|nr:hypothetical protein [Planctomycetota bacterium]